MGEPQALRVVSLGSFAIYHGTTEITANPIRLADAAGVLQTLSSHGRGDTDRDSTRSREHLVPGLDQGKKNDTLTSWMNEETYPEDTIFAPGSLFLEGMVKELSSPLVSGLWWDADAFERRTEQARGAHSGHDLTASLRLFRSALDLYNGDFLPGYDSDEWVLRRRWYYQRVFHQTMKQALRLHIDAKSWSGAETLCQRALRIDPWEEYYHVMWLEILFGQGYRDDASEYYEVISHRFQQEMGIPMLPQFHGVFQRLQKVALPKRQASGPVVDLEQFHEELGRRDKAVGAFCCDLATFRLLCRLELRRSSRSKEPVMLGSIVVRSQVDQVCESAATILEETLCSVLRQGDVICQRGENQFLLLLQRLVRTDFPKVAARMEKTIRSNRHLDQTVIDISGRPLTRDNGWLT